MIQVGSIVYVTDFPQWGWAVVEEPKFYAAGVACWRIRFFDDVQSGVTYTWVERALMLA